MSENNNKKGSFKQTFFLFVIFFLLSEFLIVRPLQKKAENEKRIQNTQNEIQMANEIQKKNDKEGKEVIIENDYLKLTVNTKGLILDDAELKKYKININSDENIKILNNTKDSFYRLNINWLSYTPNLIIPDNNSLWTSEQIDNKTIFSFSNEDNITFKIIMYLDDKYALNVEQIIENNSNKKIFIRPFWQLERYQLKEDITAFNGGIGYFNNSLEEIKTKKLDKKNFEFEKFKWAGLTDKYWLTAIINDNTNTKINYLNDNAVVKVQYIT